jgi:hypothetical protein
MVAKKIKSVAKKATAKAAKGSVKALQPARTLQPVGAGASTVSGYAGRSRDMSDMEFEEELLPGGGAFGRCGGREITNRVEQMACNLLQSAGIAHTHSPRYFEVRFPDKMVGAYAPEIVLRGRGREGKTVILETALSLKDEAIKKIIAFRKQYGIEFYVILIAREEVLDDVSIETYDESCSLVDLPTLVGRLSD